MKPSLMSLSVPPNFAGNIPAGCPRWGVRDATARPWRTSSKSPSPPTGRYVQELDLARGFDPPHLRHHGGAVHQAGLGEAVLDFVPAGGANVGLLAPERGLVQSQ